MQLVSTAIFLGSVQLAPGPLGYMYMQEVSNYKGVAVGSANMWFILIIIGLPWVNPLFEYPNQLKNIVEWNYFFLMISFYVPLSLLFYKNNK